MHLESNICVTSCLQLSIQAWELCLFNIKLKVWCTDGRKLGSSMCSLALSYVNAITSIVPS